MKEPRFEKGDQVTAEVRWPGGRVTTTAGTFLFHLGDKAYIETSVGTVEVLLETVEEA